MKVILKAILCSTLLLGINSAQAGIVGSTREALRYFQTSTSSTLTANEKIFLNNMKTNYSLLKDFDKGGIDETSKDYHIVLILEEVKELSKQLVDLSDTLSNPQNEGYNQAVITLRAIYNLIVEKDLWGQLERWSQENEQLYTFSVKEFFQNFGVKTAWAASSFVGDPETIRKALEQIRKNKEKECKDKGMELYNDSCCKTSDSLCICLAIGGTLAEDGTCCPNTDMDCYCAHSPSNGYCQCRHLRGDEYQRCLCSKWGEDYELVTVLEGTLICCLKSDEYCQCRKTATFEECKCKKSEDKTWTNGHCCLKGEVWIDGPGDGNSSGGGSGTAGGSGSHPTGGSSGTADADYTATNEGNNPWAGGSSY